MNHSNSLLELAKSISVLQDKYLKCTKLNPEKYLTIKWDDFFDFFIDRFKKFLDAIDNSIQLAEKTHWENQQNTLELLIQVQDRSKFALDSIKLKRICKPNRLDNPCYDALKIINHCLIIESNLAKYLQQLSTCRISIETEGRMQLHKSLDITEQGNTTEQNGRKLRPSNPFLLLVVNIFERILQIFTKSFWELVFDRCWPK